MMSRMLYQNPSLLPPEPSRRRWLALPLALVMLALAIVFATLATHAG